MMLAIRNGEIPFRVFDKGIEDGIQESQTIRGPGGIDMTHTSLLKSLPARS
jgi:hypothetical protein